MHCVIRLTRVSIKNWSKYVIIYIKKTKSQKVGEDLVMIMKTSVIIAAAGIGKRMGADIAKQYLVLKGDTVLYRTMKRFDKNENIDEMVVIINKEDSELFESEIMSKYIFNKKVTVAYGGEERVNSVINGLEKVSEDTDIVLVHDGVRPFLNDRIIDENIEKASEYGACLTAVPTKDTVKIVEDGFVKSTPLRETVYLAQTPQSFKKDILIEAYEKLGDNTEGITDDCMVVEKAGYKIKIVEGSYENIKITTPEDLFIGEKILENGERL